MILAALAAAAVVIVVIILAAVKPHTSNQPAGANAGRATTGGATATAGGRPAAGPKVALPTAGGTLVVGQDPSYVAVAPNGKFAYITDAGAKAITVLDTSTDKAPRTIPIPEGPAQFVSFSNDSKTAYVSVYDTRGSVHLSVTWNHYGVAPRERRDRPVASPQADGDGGPAGDGYGAVRQMAGSQAARAGC